MPILRGPSSSANVSRCCAKTCRATARVASIFARPPARCAAAGSRTSLPPPPRRPAAPDAAPATSNYFEESETSPMTTPTRILTVDDSASMRALLNQALTSGGFTVAQADDGIAALEWLASNEVDVVITDINMPRLDGFGLIEQLRTGSRHRDRPILVLSTESSDD